MGEKGPIFPFHDGLLHFSPSFHPQQQAIGLQNFDHHHYHHNSPLIACDEPQMTNQNLAKYNEDVGQNNLNYNNCHVGDVKKIVRRDVERKRRKEMSGLFRSLMALIPYEYIKGKRSTSDRLQETVKYVRELRKSVEGLKSKREELIKEINNYYLSSSYSLDSNSKDNNTAVIKCSKNIDDDDDDDESRVKVKHCKTGKIEVIVNIASWRRSEIPISELMRSIVVGFGLSITSCIFTTVNQRLLHCIEVEVVEGRNIDLAQLEKKLMDLINNNC